MSSLSESEMINEIIRELGIKYILEGYDPSYKFFIQNWQKICGENDCPMRKILILETFPNETHILGTLTSLGFIVRRDVEFLPCSECEKNAVLTESMWNIGMENEQTRLHWTFLNDRSWSSVCSDCQ